MPSSFILTGKKFLTKPPGGGYGATFYMANVGWDRMNPGIRILSQPRANGLLGGRMSG